MMPTSSMARDFLRLTRFAGSSASSAEMPSSLSPVVSNTKLLSEDFRVHFLLFCADSFAFPLAFCVVLAFSLANCSSIFHLSFSLAFSFCICWLSLASRLASSVSRSNSIYVLTKSIMDDRSSSDDENVVDQLDEVPAKPSPKKKKVSATTIDKVRL